MLLFSPLSSHRCPKIFSKYLSSNRFCCNMASKDALAAMPHGQKHLAFVVADA
jgi:hypothetical protein